MVLASATQFLSPWIDGIYLATSVIFLERRCRGLPFQWTIYTNMSPKVWLIASAVWMLRKSLHSSPAALALPHTSILHVSEDAWTGLGCGRGKYGEDFEMCPCSAVSLQVAWGFINHRKCRNKEASPIGVLIWILTFSFLIYKYSWGIWVTPDLLL